MTRGSARTVTALAAVTLAALLAGCQGAEAAPSPSPARVTRADYLARMARTFNVANPPEVDAVRVVEPEDQQPLVKQCMDGLGFVADASNTITVPNGEVDELDLAYYTCYARYPIDERYLQPLTESQHRYIHDYWLASELPCLAGLGHEVPPPPAVDVYLARLGTPDEYTISGQLLALGMSQDELESVLATCPETPRASEVVRH